MTMKIRQLLVGGGTAAVLASTALVGITAGTAHAELTCQAMENARVAAVDAYNGAHASWQYYTLIGDASSTSYYYNMSEFWQGRVDYFTHNLQAC